MRRWEERRGWEASTWSHSGRGGGGCGAGRDERHGRGIWEEGVELRMGEPM